MGLAPYGWPHYTDLILKHLLDLKPEGSFWMNMEYFNYCQELTMTNEKVRSAFRRPAAQAEAMLGAV
jgi:carbamoyltransferase